MEILAGIWARSWSWGENVQPRVEESWNGWGRGNHRNDQRRLVCLTEGSRTKPFPSTRIVQLCHEGDKCDDSKVFVNFVIQILGKFCRVEKTEGLDILKAEPVYRNFSCSPISDALFLDPGGEWHLAVSLVVRQACMTRSGLWVVRWLSLYVSMKAGAGPSKALFSYYPVYGIMWRGRYRKMEMVKAPSCHWSVTGHLQSWILPRRAADICVC